MRFKKIDKAILSGLAATSIMTLVSCGVSKLKKQNLNEPDILGVLLQDSIKDKKLARTAGWTMHYLLGLQWALLTEILFKSTTIKKSIINSLILGTISGIAGIILWKAIFRFHRKTLSTNVSLFYQQLMLAHVVFMLTYVLLNRDKALFKQLTDRLPIV